MARDIKKYVQLGKNIQFERKLKNLSQNKFAEIIDISREHLAKIETAKKGVSIDLLFKIADALNIKVIDLFKNI